MEDNRIIELFFARNENAIAETARKYGRLCTGLASGILKNASDAEECVNDCWLGTWNSIPPNRPESLMGYVCKITRNLAIKRYHHNRAAKRNSEYDTALEELEEVLVSSKDVESEVEASLLTKTIEEFLDQQEQTDRVIFVKRYFFSASYKDIAAETGLTDKNVSVKLVRIRKALKDFLKERGYIV